MSTASATGVSFARAALVGNPSDGYGGATLALALPQLRAEAEVTLTPAGEPRIDPPSDLVRASVSRFAREMSIDPSPTAVRWHSSIPRSVGLGGSSAIVIATLRALCAVHAARLDPLELAQMAFAVEVADLGIAAGMQDRLVQSFEGLVFMDFAGDRPRVQRLDEELLPPLVVAWRADYGGDSGVVHRALRERFERREEAVAGGMRALATLAQQAKDALLARDLDSFARSVDQSFEIRRAMIRLDERHVAMIKRARDAGASANYTGSGGAIVAVCRDAAHRQTTADALTGLGCATIG